MRQARAGIWLSDLRRGALYNRGKAIIAEYGENWPSAEMSGGRLLLLSGNGATFSRERDHQKVAAGSTECHMGPPRSSQYGLHRLSRHVCYVCTEAFHEDQALLEITNDLQMWLRSDSNLAYEPLTCKYSLS